MSLSVYFDFTFLMAVMSVCSRKAPSTLFKGVLFADYLYNQVEDMPNDSGLLLHMLISVCA